MDKMYTIKSLVPKMTHNELCKYNKAGDVDWFIESAEFKWGDRYFDRYFSEQELNNLPSALKEFVYSEFCEVRAI